MELPAGCKMMKVQEICHSGFLWSFEFLNYADASENKKKLHFMEEHLKLKLWQRPNFHTNFNENQFVAVEIEKLRRVVRGYVLSVTHDRVGDMYQVFLIDYGSKENVHSRDLRILPDYASVEKLPAQSWRIGLYGVLPVHLELELGGSANKTVGEAWNGKDIKFMEDALSKADVIHFEEVIKHQEYRFGYVHLKRPGTRENTTLQKLLVEEGYAVESEDFNKYIPSIVRRIRTTQDHKSFPTGDPTDKSDSVDGVETPVIASKSDQPQTADSPSSSSKSGPAALETSSSSASSSQIKGRGRGELLQKLKIVKAPPPEPAPMVGRIPMNEIDQFEDSLDSVYHDAINTSKTESSRRDSFSSTEFHTPKNSTPSSSRRQSCSSIEITSDTNQPKIETISLITPPPNDPAILSFSRKRNVETIDLTTSPPTVSLITPSPSPHSNLADDSCSENSPQSGSVEKPARGRAAKLIAAISSMSNESQPPKSDISDHNMSEKLSRLLKIDSTPKPGSSRGRGALKDRIISDSSCSSRKSSIDSTASAEPTPVKPSSIDFANDIVPLNTVPVASVPEEQIVDEVAQDDMFGEEEDFNEKLITQIMVVGDEGACRFKPKFAINDFDLHPDVKKRAGQLRLTDLIRSQRYMIPAMLTRRNVTLVGPSRGGKTVSCLIALFSLLKEKKFYKALPVGPGPRAIILCPYSSQCENIERICNELNKSVASISSTQLPERDVLKLNVAYGCGKEAEKDKLNELTQGYDIVICTPSCLLRLLQTPEMMNFKRLCHLVLDDADTLFKSYTDEIIEILQQAYSSGKICENGLVLPQRVIISREWIPMIKQWVQKDVTEQRGILLMASYSEAAVFCNVKAMLRRIDDEDKKRNDLINYLHTEAPQKSTVVVFNNVEEMNEVYTWLKSKCMRPLFKVGYSLGSAEDIVANWKRSSDEQQYPIICCTDNTLHDLNIYMANSLIHYNLPTKERGYFTERFSVLLHRLAGPPEFYTPGKMPSTFSKTDTLIYVGPNDHLQFPTVIKLMEKLRMKIPEELKITAKELLQARELEKDGNKLCENYKKFGQCSNEKICPSRHYFSKLYDEPASDIPREGRVKMQILQVYSASHYCARLLEHSDAQEKKWTLIKPPIHPGVLNAKMNMYFSNREKRAMHLCQNVGEVAAIETTSDMFKRVQILELVMDEKFDELRNVKVKFIDDGRIDDVRPSVLVKLPPEFADVPSTTVDIFLCNVLPVDRDVEWGDIITHKVRERILMMQDSEDVDFIGEIKLVSGRDVWVDPLRCDKVYDRRKDIITIVSSMCRDLLNKKVAVENPNHLPKLLSMYQEAGLLELPKATIQSITEPSVVQNNAASTSVPSEPEKPSCQPNSIVEALNESSSSDSTVIEDPLNDTEDDNVNNTEDDDENDIVPKTVPYESEEEWPLEDEPQTPAAPIQSKPEANSKPKLRNESDSEYDQYDYDTDSMPENGLQEEFDYYFKPDDMDDLVEVLYPGFKQMKISANKEKFSKPSIAAAQEPEKPTIGQIANSCVPQQPIYAYEPEDSTKYILKPRTEWYQDATHVYMNIALNVDEYVIRLTANSIYFRAVYNERIYEFDEKLYTTIENENSKHYKSSVMIAVKMEKVIKLNNWPRIFKTKFTSGWIKRSVHILDEDLEVPDMCWDQKLNTGLALKTPEIPDDFKYISNYDTNVTIYPEGYEELHLDSDEDSDGVGNDEQDPDE